MEFTLLYSLFSPDKNAEGPRRQATNSAAGLQLVKLPSIKARQASKPRIPSACLKCFRQLKSQVWDLQPQLRGVQTENKLLKRIQHRHTVALQHYQDSEDSLSQVAPMFSGQTSESQKHTHPNICCLLLFTFTTKYIYLSAVITYKCLVYFNFDTPLHLRGGHVYSATSVWQF